jgi:hemerythrin superfamily protein
MDSSNLQETLTAIEASISENEQVVKRGDALERMKLTNDYKTVFVDGYIDTESKELFEILTDPSGASPYSTEKIHLMLEAISHFKGFVGTEDFQGTVEQDAKYAVTTIENDRNLRKEITALAATEED